MAIYKINFRETAGYVTDGADSTYCIGETSRTALGLTFGFASDISSGTGTNNVRNRTTGSPNNPELSGMAFKGNSPGSHQTFTVTLPSTGAWRIRAAFGDAGNAQTIHVLMKDNTTTFATISNKATAVNEFVDATGVVRTASAWSGSNAYVDQTFASTTFNIEIGDGASDGLSTCIAHLVLESLSGSSSALPVIERITRGQFRGQY